MRLFQFDHTKYGFHFEMDLHRFEDNPAIYFEPELHTVNFFEIMFIREGVGVAYTNENRIELNPGTILFASPNQIKQCDFEKETISGFHLIFKPEFLESLYQDKSFVYKLPYFYNYSFSPHMIIAANDYVPLNTGLNEMLSEITTFRFNSPDIIRSLLYSILLRLDRLFREFHQIGDNLGNENLLVRFKIAMEEHIGNNLNCSQYADLLNVHRNELNKKVKMYTGYTAMELLHNRKVLEIKYRLLRSEQSIAEIAYDFHFSDPNNLSRFFKKATGMSPVSYRQKLQNDSLR